MIKEIFQEIDGILVDRVAYKFHGKLQKSIMFLDPSPFEMGTRRWV